MTSPQFAGPYITFEHVKYMVGVVSLGCDSDLESQGGPTLEEVRQFRDALKRIHELLVSMYGPQTRVVTAYQPVRDSTGRSGPIGIAFLDKRAGELWCQDHTQEFVGYKIREVQMTKVTDEHGMIEEPGNDFEGHRQWKLVLIRTDAGVDMLRARALAKLTDAECAALGVRKH